MSLSIHATFAAETLAGGPEIIGIQMPLAMAAIQTPRSPDPAKKNPKTKKVKIYPVESYYLNGAQYLTGGVGNRLAFGG